jgi:carboxyl-terminal processing protease
MPVGKVVKLIRGPKGTLVTLTVKKPDKKILVIPITRDVVVIEDSYARGAVLDLGDQNDAMGYIYLPSFYGEMRKGSGSGSRNASDDVRGLLQMFSKQKLGGVVIDLRGNPGGLLGHALSTARWWCWWIASALLRRRFWPESFRTTIAR